MSNEQLELFEVIKKAYPKLSKGHRILAEYIINNYEKAAFLTASKLGEVVGLSESTVVRFATSLGYSGFPKLQRQLQDAVKEKLDSVERLQLSSDYMDSTTVLQKVLNIDIENIKLTLDEIDENKFSQVVEVISNADNVHIIGLRSANSLARFMGYYLNLILKNVRVIENDLGDIYEQLLSVKENDVVIAISFPRYTRLTVETFEFAKRRGVKGIALTDSSLSPIGEKADILLNCKCDMASFIDSLVAPMSIINAIIIALGMKKKDEISSTLGSLEEVWTKHNVFLTKDKKDFLVL